MKQIKRIGFKYLGFQPYQISTQIQDQLQNLLVKGETDLEGFLLFLYHEPIITLGRYSDCSHLLVVPEKLGSLGVALQRSDRGGDITCHEHGQLVIYPIINIGKFNLKLKDYVFLLEKVVMEFLKRLGIRSHRVVGKPGLWIGNNKIASIGINVKRRCTKHGIAINVNNDLKTFDLVNPCGYEGVGVTSVKKVLKRKIDIEECIESILNIFSDTLGTCVEEVDISSFISLNLLERTSGTNDATIL